MRTELMFENACRWLKRPMVHTFEAWRDTYQTEKRNRQILERMAYRLRNACVVAAFADWNNYVDIMVPSPL
jgi:hypothetical protein